MEASEVARAVAAARWVAASLGLTADEATVANNSNKLAVRLAPCEVLARVAPSARQNLQFEIDVARRLGEVGSPVAALDPRVEPRVYGHDGFAVTLWTYYPPGTPPDITPRGYASALARLHAGMRTLEVESP